MPNQKTIQWITDAIPGRVRGGFVSEDELLDELQERIEDEVEDPSPELLAEVQALVSLSFAEHQKEEINWRERTVNDAIDAAFETLNRQGIVALQNAGYTMSEGWGEVNEMADSLETAPRGAIFYHGQDLERGVAGHGLMLTFGAYEEDEAKHEAASLQIARETREVLSQYGVVTSWDETIGQRIVIPPFHWRKRHLTQAPESFQAARLP
ncbi:DUF6891 domain-containing protein [Deinococcus altitudinis]|uniref:DUF6891 domain-containing protein n=1 Tax=Deinococcus altitudinis TaxID=468914 RepID=UPI0038911BBE